MSGDPEQEYFADGMVEEIITALVAHPLAVRHRPQFELHLQGPSGRCEAGRARAWRALCARRLGAQRRQPGAHHCAVDRRRLPARISGPTGSTARSKMSSSFRTRWRSSVAGVIEPALQAAETARSANRPTDRSDRLRPLSCAPMRCSGRRQRKSPRRSDLMEQAIARDPRYGPALAWAAFCCLRLLHDGRSEDPAGGSSEGRRFRQAGLGSGRRRSGHPGECRLGAGLFRRGHRRHDGAGRPCPGAQPELSRAAGSSAASSGFGRASPTSRSSISRARCASAPAPVSARRIRIIGARPFLQPALRRGSAEPAPRDPG